MRRAWSWVIFGAALTLSGASHAEDVRALEKRLSDEVSALSTSDCNLACRALASIRRAAERICALEPGPECDAARAKAAEAARRVREACPGCASVDVELDEERATPAAAPASAPEGQTVNVSAPAPKRGGCKSCTTAPLSADPEPAAWLLVGLGLFWRRRHVQKNRRRV